MKTMSAQEAKSHFGELLEAAQQGPIVVTQNDRPVSIMISIEDAADTLIPDLFMPREAGYDDWLMAKVGRTLARVASGQTALTPHDQALKVLDARAAVKRRSPAD